MNTSLDSEKVSINSTQRIEALADGIFSIVLTLIVFDLKIPEIPYALKDDWATLKIALFAMWPQLVTFIFSFIILGIFWMGNRSHLSKVERTNRPYEFLNLLFFFSVSIIPFATETLAHYTMNPSAIIFYSCIIFIAGMLFMLKWTYAVRHGLTYTWLSRERILGVYRRSLVNPICALFAIISSFIDIRISYFFFILPILYYVYPEQVEHHFVKMKRPLIVPSTIFKKKIKNTLAK